MAIYLGIDPGLATVGFGIIDDDGRYPHYVDCGIIKTPASASIGERLCIIKNDIQELLNEFKPVAVGVEELFFVKNVTNGIKVAQARGVIVSELYSAGVLMFELTPLQVKNNIAGHGTADKKSVQIMVQRLLKLNTFPKPDDAADAVAIAILTGRLYNQLDLKIKNA